MIIGLTGKNAGGKGELAQFLQSCGFIYYSLSDVLRDELETQKKTVSRENLIEIGTTLRTSYGNGVLAYRILEKLEIDKNYVIDSFRHPVEVEVFRRNRKDFKLIEVKADASIRFERICSRKRESDPQTLEAFQILEEKEAASLNSSGQQLNATGAMADHQIDNNSTLEDLREKSRQLMSQVALHQPRPDWDEYFMSIAKVVALRSNCMKRKVAAVIVKDQRIISTGYNGTPRGVKNCNEGGCPRCNRFALSGTQLEDCYCSHAEENAITQAAYHGVSIKGATLYTTFSPCLLCTKMILNSGIEEVIFDLSYSLGENATRLLEEAKIKIRSSKKQP